MTNTVYIHPRESVEFVFMDQDGDGIAAWEGKPKDLALKLFGEHIARLID
jgi:hypothetical protein